MQTTIIPIHTAEVTNHLFQGLFNFKDEKKNIYKHLELMRRGSPQDKSSQ